MSYCNFKFELEAYIIKLVIAIIKLNDLRDKRRVNLSNLY